MAFYRNLKITLYPKVGIITGKFFPLDGILLSTAMRLEYGDTFTPTMLTLPIKKIDEKEDSWFYSCSWATPLQWWRAEHKTAWAKRLNMLNASNFIKKNGKRKINMSEGNYRPYYVPLYYRVAEKVVWYCLGLKEEIEFLLSHTLAVGKKTSQGWGFVNRWTVEEIDNDFSVRKEDKLTRGIPAQPENTVDIIRFGLRPPYYAKGNLWTLQAPSL